MLRAIELHPDGSDEQLVVLSAATRCLVDGYGVQGVVDLLQIETVDLHGAMRVLARLEERPTLEVIDS